MINRSINWAIDNKEWLFSGLGLLIVTVFFGFIKILYSWISKLNNSTVPEEDMREMEQLVIPLYSRIGDDKIFINRTFEYRNMMGMGVKEHLDFWEDIKQNKHLGSPELRLAIDDYEKSKSDKINGESYEKAETKLYEVIRNRYSELENKYSNSRNFGTKST